MFLKKRKASTDPRLRSLLQKAVRRGAPQVVEATARCLLALGDKTWLRSRAVVITFEEAWPLAQSLRITQDHETKIIALLSAARSAKQKDAAGLGALAFAFHEGDKSMEDVVPSRRDLRIVSEAVSRPAEFFGWATTQCRSECEASVVRVAREYLPAATWGWDKATILAGAFLAVSAGLPPLPPGELMGTDFPYWVALDKHTPEGKEALHQVGVSQGERYRQLIWASFYCESAVVNRLCPSVWFAAEREWRLRKAGLTLDAAAQLWSRVGPALQAHLGPMADELRKRVEGGPMGQDEFPLESGRGQGENRFLASPGGG